MHELSLCMALVQQLEAIAREHDSQQITEVALAVGPLSGVDPGLLQNAYPMAAAGTPAENSVLVMQTADVVVRCRECGSQSTVVANKLLCGSCGDFRTQVISGDELTLLRVELEPRA